jgi:general secretion pathway protein E
LLLEDDGHALTLWHHGQPDLSALGEVMRKYLSEPALTLERLDAAALAQRISSAYAKGESSAAAVVSEVESDADLTRMMQELPAVEDLLEAADDAPIIRMLNALLTQAARDGASDIHIEPYERTSSVRFRVDGTLREVVQPNRALHAALISRLKIMAELDIAEKRLPQDGRISLRIGTRAVDVRVSTLPSAHGERAVLRLLDKSESQAEPGSLGMQGEVLQRFEQLIAQPHGIILVTGPTGSGKTTTLYAALQPAGRRQHQHHDGRRPDRVRAARHRPDAGQCQDRPDLCQGLRAILRQDPDVIMIGEIRDFETAQIAIQASLTGHLVLATCTPTTRPARDRLIDMGVEPFLLSSSPAGRAGAAPGAQAVRPHCKGDELRAQIHNRAPKPRSAATALAAGMTLMRDDGERLVRRPASPAREELVRVTRD